MRLRLLEARRSPSRRSGQPDYGLLTLSLGLLAFGWVMMCSASWSLGEQQYGDPYYFIKRQSAYTLLGLAGMAYFIQLPYKRLREWVWPALGLCLLALVAVLFARPVAGVKRWIRLGPLGLQPAEFAKLAVVLYLADYVDRKRSKIASPLHGFLIPWTVTGAALGLMLLEPDLGTPALLFAVAALMLFVGGTPLRHLGGTLLCAAPLLAYELLKYPYRRKRLLNFLEPFSDPQGAGYQLVQSLYAVGSGGWLGKGLGHSRLKLGYLPAPHTDFVFPVLCEELGLAGSLAVLTLFAAFLVKGMRVARSAPDLFGSLLASGLSFLIGLQAFFNVAMSIGLLPTKGLPLPFFSYGGSSILVTLAATGILLNVSKNCGVRTAVRR